MHKYIIYQTASLVSNSMEQSYSLTISLSFCHSGLQLLPMFGLSSLARLSQIIQCLDLHFSSLCLISVKESLNLEDSLYASLMMKTSWASCNKKKIKVIYLRFKVVNKAKAEKHLSRVVEEGNQQRSHPLATFSPPDPKARGSY